MPSGAATLILSAGELLWDLLPSGPRLGGTTTNFAVLSARLGNNTMLLGRVGKDAFGQRALELLTSIAAAGRTEHHFDLHAVQLSDDLPTGTVSVSFDAQKRPSYVITQPVAWDQIALTPELLTLAGQASAICFGTLAQRDPRSRQTIRALIEASAPGCLRVCDVNLRMPFCTAETLRWCLKTATVLKISEEELPAVGKMLELDSLEQPLPTESAAVAAWAAKAAAALLNAAPACRILAITLGPAGSVLTDGTTFDHHPGIPVHVADTVGAGDAFTAGMVHALLRAGSLRQINQVSNLCGSFVAGQPGATPEPTEALLQQIKDVLGS